MDTINNSLGFGSSSDPKTTIMNQIRQEAAVTNARQLIEVRSTAHPLVSFTDMLFRNSTNIASRSVSQSQGPHYRGERRPALRSVWRSIWPRGTRLAGSILRGSSRSRDEGGWEDRYSTREREMEFGRGRMTVKA